MKELSREELLEILGYAFSDYTSDNEVLDEFKEKAKQSHLQIRKLIEEKPEVTKEFVEKWAHVFFDYLDTHYFKSTKQPYDVYKHILEQMLIEASVEVEK